MTTKAGQALTQEEALLRAICQNPGDDDPRLRYADLLDERAVNEECPRCGNPSDGLTWTDPFAGEPKGRLIKCSTCEGAGFIPGTDAMRAEFVRVQCQLANDDADDAAKGRLGTNPLRRRERELFARLTGGGFDLRGLPNGCVVTIDAINVELGRSHPNPGFPVAFVRRGFVDEVRLPLAAFVGGPCGRCQGLGGRYGDRAMDAANRTLCHNCKATGRVGGLAGRLFAGHPITRVVIPNVPPAVTSGLSTFPGSPYYGFGPEIGLTNANPDNRLPPPLFDRLEGYLTGLSPFFSSSWRFYPTEAAALAALSAACVAYGRAQVSWFSRG